MECTARREPPHVPARYARVRRKAAWPTACIRTPRAPARARAIHSSEEKGGMADGVHSTPRALACARATRSREERGGMADGVHPHAASPRMCPRDTLV